MESKTEGVVATGVPPELGVPTGVARALLTAPRGDDGVDAVVIVESVEPLKFKAWPIPRYPSSLSQIEMRIVSKTKNAEDVSD